MNKIQEWFLNLFFVVVYFKTLLKNEIILKSNIIQYSRMVRKNPLFDTSVSIGIWCISKQCSVEENILKTFLQTNKTYLVNAVNNQTGSCGNSGKRWIHNKILRFLIVLFIYFWFNTGNNRFHPMRWNILLVLNQNVTWIDVMQFLHLTFSIWCNDYLTSKTYWDPCLRSM